jgi:hypothetical protein
MFQRLLLAAAQLEAVMPQNIIEVAILKTNGIL